MYVCMLLLQQVFDLFEYLFKTIRIGLVNSTLFVIPVTVVYNYVQVVMAMYMYFLTASEIIIILK